MLVGKGSIVEERKLQVLTEVLEKSAGKTRKVKSCGLLKQMIKEKQDILPKVILKK